jgi:hypothetical protein
MKAIAPLHTLNLPLMVALAGAMTMILYPAAQATEQENFDTAVNLLETGDCEINADLSSCDPEPTPTHTTDTPLLEKLRQLSELKSENQTANTSSHPPAIASFPTANEPLPKGLLKLAQTPETASSVKILTPSPDSIADVPASTVILQFPPGEKIELRVNGVLVDSGLIGRTETNQQTNLVTQTWFGVSLKEGSNTISAHIAGETEAAASVQVTVRGAPTKLQLETVEASIPADGRSLATIRGQLIDANGNRSRSNAVVTVISTAGEFVGTDSHPNQPGFQVEAKGGEFTVQLRSPLQAQTIRIRALTNNLEAFTQIQVATALRSSLVTGVIDMRLGGRTTNFYGRFRDFLPPDTENNTQLDVRSAVFATGTVGDWLFTGAYDSQRNLNEDCCQTRLFRQDQFIEQNYPVYGDSSTIDVLTPSSDSLYLRFERSSKTPGTSPDFFMWGNYSTQEFARQSQQYTALTRQLQGFKTNYNFGNWQFTGFYGNNVQSFQRDIIPPDGTSGFYFLSRRLLIRGSENIFLELEELNRPGTVLERQQLNRGPDYEIDYDRGTILFREPILRTDINDNGEVLVRRIVVTYQYESQDNDSNIYAGRLQYNLSRVINQESWLGATYIRENQGVRGFELYGADAMISLGSRGKLMAEYAHSSNDSDVMGLVSGQAYRIEAQGEIFPRITGRAYYRYADTGFANNATISFIPGQTRYGAQLTGRLTTSTQLRLQYDHEDNFGTAPQPLDTFEELFNPNITTAPGSQVDNSLTTITAGIQQQLGSGRFNVDWIRRDREDRMATENPTTTSDQLRSRFTIPIAKNLTFLAQNELTLSNQTDRVFPDRSIFGINWAAIPGINISLSQQFYSTGQFAGNSITNLSINGEHKLTPDTSITGRYTILGGANQITTQGAVGLNNRWTIAPGLRLNLAYEHVFGDFVGTTGAGQQFLQPLAIGQNASALGFQGGDSYSASLEYTDNPNFKASARYERRNSSRGNNTVISGGVTGKISPSLTALVRYQQASAANQRLTGLGDTANLRVGLAYRDPNNDKFNALLRYEYRKNPAIIPNTILSGNGTGSQDHTFAAEAIYAPNWQWEFYGKYALRHSTSYLAQDLAGTSTVNLAQLRATYRLGYSIDLVTEARVINQSNYTETGVLLEAGYYLTPNLRLAAGYALGKVDDRDFSGTRSAGGPYLGLTVKLNELFSGFGLQKVPPPQPPAPMVKNLLNHIKDTKATQVVVNTLIEQLKRR